MYLMRSLYLLAVVLATPAFADQPASIPTLPEMSPVPTTPNIPPDVARAGETRPGIQHPEAITPPLPLPQIAPQRLRMPLPPGMVLMPQAAIDATIGWMQAPNVESLVRILGKLAACEEVNMTPNPQAVMRCPEVVSALTQQGEAKKE